MTLADLLGVARALATVPIVWAIASDARPVALGLFVLAALSDAADGWIARRAESTEARGALIDPIADKVLVVGTLVALAAVGRGWPVTVVAVLALAREGLVAYARVRAYQRGGGARPADRVAKWKTAAEMLGVALVIIGTRPWAVAGTGIVGIALAIGVLTLPHHLRRDTTPLN